jgi:tRNA (guanine37-N1)-methyltransferase
MHFNLITLFPDMFPGTLGQALAGKALEKNLWSYTAINPRDFATDVHKTVDDTPFGGGAGMILKPDILERAIRSLGCHPREGGDPAPIQSHKLIYLSARGRKLTQKIVQELAATPRVTLLCGRYEGVDQRVLDAYGFDEICIGDYVLSGGEVAAQVLMDAVIRLLPGVMGNDQTAGDESFTNPHLLEYPHYTRPADWVDARGQTHSVPEILRSGNHAAIKAWRDEQARTHTTIMRPDLGNKIT